MTTSAPEAGFVTPMPAPEADKLFSTPDHTKSRDVPPGVKKAIGKLGNNKKPRSGLRALKPEDIGRIEDYYTMLAMVLTPFKPKVSEAIQERTQIRTEDGIEPGPTRARVCAEAWYELGQQNDSVRRVILMLVEGGAWTAVLAANAPIAIAALPDDALARLMFRFMPPKPEDTYDENSPTYAREDMN